MPVSAVAEAGGNRGSLARGASALPETTTGGGGTMDVQSWPLRRHTVQVLTGTLLSLSLLGCAPGARPAAEDTAVPGEAESSAQADASTTPAASATPAASETPHAPTATATPACPRGEVEPIPVEGKVTSLEDALVHGDLNPSLRGSEPMETALDYVDYDGGTDANAPQLTALLGRKPVLTGAWDVYEWDWTVSPPRRHESIFREVHGVPWPALVGMATTPGEEIRVPGRAQDIYQGRFHALLVSASETDLQWVYTRADDVGSGYAVWVAGLVVDCNLLERYQAGRRSGEGLPGLSADQVVGIAAGEEIRVAIRDRGSFMDVRSTKDWWR